MRVYFLRLWLAVMLILPLEGIQFADRLMALPPIPLQGSCPSSDSMHTVHGVDTCVCVSRLYTYTDSASIYLHELDVMIGDR